MTSKEFAELLERRAEHAGVAVPSDLTSQLETYVRLLARWNATINLTSLPVHELTEQTIDRLLIEPLAAARHIDDSATPWVDVGSGGGSPALPLRLAKPALRLTMVESKARKAAFLREAVRALTLDDVAVENTRIEQFAERPDVAGAFGLATLRAVRADSQVVAALSGLLRPKGRLAIFQPRPDESEYVGFERRSSALLIGPPHSAYLAVFDACVPRGTSDNG